MSVCACVGCVCEWYHSNRQRKGVRSTVVHHHHHSTALCVVDCLFVVTHMQVSLSPLFIQVQWIREAGGRCPVIRECLQRGVRLSERAHTAAQSTRGH